MAFTDKTDLSKLIVPEVFSDYVQRQSTQTNRLIQSGIISTDPVLGSRLLQPGWLINVPQLNDLTGDPQEWDDKTDIKTDSLDSAEEQEVKFSDAKAFAATDFGQLISGAPVAQQIASRFSAWWTRLDERRALRLVKNTFLNADVLAAKGFHIGSETDLSAKDFIAALSRMGDVMNNTLSKVAVNSAAYAEMSRQNLIEYVQPSNVAMPTPTYQGMTIVQDDSIPVDSKGVTSAFIFGNGSIHYSTAIPSNGVVVDRDETSNGGQQAVINKRMSTMHIEGTSLDLTQLTSGNPANFRSDFENGKALYKVASDPRDIQIVQYGFKIGTDLLVPGVNTTDAPKSTSGK